MGVRGSRFLRARRLTRRALVGAAGGAAVTALLPAAGAAQDGGGLVFLTTQLTPEHEAAALRDEILAGFSGPVEVVPAPDEPFVDRVLAEAQAGTARVDVVGAGHGHFSSLRARGLLTDLSGFVEEMDDRTFVPDYLALARFHDKELFYVPWMQATYIMAARRDALKYLPEDLDEETLQTSLTYDQLTAWAKRIADAEGPKLGFPAGEDGLLHRFLEGYAYPSFTLGVNTTFKSEAAVAMWQWLKDVWAFTHPQSAEYAFMQEPLLAGEVWVAWDHTARLIGALRDRPDDFVTFPAPRGPAGLGYMPVLAGLGIPKNAPDPEASRALIEYLTSPEVQAITLRAVSFFPAIDTELPEDLPAGTRAEADAINATLASDRAIPSLLPVGLGDQNGAYNAVFRQAFQRIVLGGEEIRAVLEAEAVALQGVLDAAQAACWAPDPRSDGVCPVG